jgi:hypothetical protein
MLTAIPIVLLLTFHPLQNQSSSWVARVQAFTPPTVVVWQATCSLLGQLAMTAQLYQKSWS